MGRCWCTSICSNMSRKEDWRRGTWRWSKTGIVDSRIDHHGSKKHNRQNYPTNVYFILPWESLTDMKSLSLFCGSIKTFPKNMLKSKLFFILQDKLHGSLCFMSQTSQNICTKKEFKLIKTNLKDTILTCAPYLNKRRFKFSVHLYYTISYENLKSLFDWKFWHLKFCFNSEWKQTQHLLTHEKVLKKYLILNI